MSVVPNFAADTVHGNHTSTCTAHSGATKAHDWMVGVLGQLFRTAGHTVRTQRQRCADVELCSYLQDAAGRRSLVFDLSMTHDSFGSSNHGIRTVCYHIPMTSMRLCVLLRIAKLTAIRQQYADNQIISFLPAIVSTSARMHCEFLRLLFLQAHRETETHFTASGMSSLSQRNQSDSFRFKRDAFYQSLKSKVGLAAAKVAALMINLHVTRAVA